MGMDTKHNDMKDENFDIKLSQGNATDGKKTKSVGSKKTNLKPKKSSMKGSKKRQVVGKSNKKKK